jgi:hypothetical protein
MTLDDIPAIQAQKLPPSDPSLHMQLYHHHKQLPFYSCVYFEGSSPAKELKGVMPRELSQFYMVPCSHGNIS